MRLGQLSLLGLVLAAGVLTGVATRSTRPRRAAEVSCEEVPSLSDAPHIEVPPAVPEQAPNRLEPRVEQAFDASQASGAPPSIDDVVLSMRRECQLEVQASDFACDGGACVLQHRSNLPDSRLQDCSPLLALFPEGFQIRRTERGFDGGSRFDFVVFSASAPRSTSAADGSDG